MNPDVGRLAAVQASWDRHVRQALAIVSRPLHRKPLTVIPGDGDEMTTPSPAHPAWRGLRRRENR